MKGYHNGPGNIKAENILADVTCPFTIFIADNEPEVEPEDFTNKLKTKIETNKNKKDPKDIQPEQVDFRNVLKKGSIKTKVNQSFKAEQRDFRTSLKNQGQYPLHFRSNFRFRSKDKGSETRRAEKFEWRPD